jgi:hypothetical protein
MQLDNQMIERDKRRGLVDGRGKMDDTHTPCGCAASPMSMMLPDSSTQVSGDGIKFHVWRETGPTLSSK